MRMLSSSASNFSNFNASSSELESKLRISSMKSFDFSCDAIEARRQKGKVAVSTITQLHFHENQKQKSFLNSVSMANYLILSSTGI